MNYIHGPDESHERRATSQIKLGRPEWDFAELWRIFARRRLQIFAFVAASLVLTYIGISIATPQYTANSDILLETSEQRITDLEAVLTDGRTDKEGILSEIEVLTSRGLAEKVINRLHLDRDPEFNAALRTPNAIAVWAGKLGAAITSALPAPVASWFDAGDEAQLSPEQVARRQTDQIVNEFLDHLVVGVKNSSRVIRISATSTDPVKAAAIANAVAEGYLVDRLEAKYEATRRASEWVTTKLDDLRREVALSEAEVERYRSKAGLLQGKSGTLIAQQITDLNGQLIVARADRTAAEVRLSQVRRLAQSTGGAEAAAEVLNSPIVQSLLTQETQVKRKLAELGEEYGDKHPKLVNARAEMRDIQAKIKIEIGKVVQGLENETAVARARESALQQSLDRLEAQLTKANVDGVQLRALERQADANKTMLEAFLQRSEEIGAQQDRSIQQANARILSLAPVPQLPSSPKSIQIMVLVLLASSVAAVVLVLLLEQLDNGFRSGDQIEEFTGIRTLGLVPKLKGWGLARTPEDRVVADSESLFAEANRTIYTSLLLLPASGQSRCVLVTSAQPREGKTTLAVALGRTAALAGKSVVVVEADLRRPIIHKMIGANRSPGLADVLRGETPLADAIRRDTLTDCRFILAGDARRQSSKLIDVKILGPILAELQNRFDFVFIDSAPVMAVADARLLANLADTTIFVTRWGMTARAVARQALKTLLESGACNVCAVLSMVDADRHARYGFGDSGLYERNVRSYYAKT